FPMPFDSIKELISNMKSSLKEMEFPKELKK